MSKYNNLLHAFDAYQQKINDYEEKCESFLVKLHNFILDDFQIPNENLSYINSKKELVPTFRHNAIALEDDGFYQVRVSFKFEKLNKFDSIYIPVKVKYLDNKYIVMAGEERNRFIYENLLEDIDLSDLTAYFYKVIEDHFKNSFDNFLRNNP